MKGEGRRWKEGNVGIGIGERGGGKEMAMRVIGREEVVAGAGADLVRETEIFRLTIHGFVNAAEPFKSTIQYIFTCTEAPSILTSFWA